MSGLLVLLIKGVNHGGMLITGDLSEVWESVGGFLFLLMTGDTSGVWAFGFVNDFLWEYQRG